jgi:hypothetical protein
MHHYFRSSLLQRFANEDSHFVLKVLKYSCLLLAFHMHGHDMIVVGDTRVSDNLS